MRIVVLDLRAFRGTFNPQTWNRTQTFTDEQIHEGSLWWAIEITWDINMKHDISWVYLFRFPSCGLRPSTSLSLPVLYHLLVWRVPQCAHRVPTHFLPLFFLLLFWLSLVSPGHFAAYIDCTMFFTFVSFYCTFLSPFCCQNVCCKHSHDSFQFRARF